MCGIYFHAKKSNCFCFSEQNLKSVLRLNSYRGPNDEDIHTVQSKNWELQFNGFLLWLRGSRPQVQPLVDENGNVLLWNGDVFNEASLSVEAVEHKSDTESIASRLSKASSSSTEILQVFTQLEGPGAFIFYNRKMNTVWFGRDILGRHSLLIDVQPCHCILTSVAFRASSFNEVEALGIYQMNLNSTSTTMGLSPWKNWKTVDPTAAWTVPVQFYPSITSTLQTLSLEKLDRAYTSIQQYLDSIEGADYVHQLQSNLEKAVSERMQAQPKLCKNCCWKYNQQQQCIHCKTAILFSGGLDSTILALLAAKQLSDDNDRNLNENVSSPGGGLDLINVAFQQPDGQYDVPDRVTALQAFEELQSIYPSVRLNLVLVNVTKAELQEMREDCIRDLLHPLDTVLDDSIGCAIWFAARAKGVLVDGRAYTSPARVMLLGMGADEQLGGYSKHQAAFKHQGRDGLLKEVQRQIHAISQRNLGRDNRVVSHHGVAGRYPFLDERVISFLSSLPIEAKMNLSLPRGVGDKLILRALAFSLGLAKTSVEPKRAIQFGSRIAKLENKKEKAKDKAVRS